MKEKLLGKGHKFVTEYFSGSYWKLAYFNESTMTAEYSYCGLKTVYIIFSKNWKVKDVVC
jgi:hypothetical protein